MTQDIIKNHYTFSAIPDKIQKELAIVKFDVIEYVEEINKYKKDRPLNQFYYDYNKELDFSIDTKDPRSIEKKIYDDRWYYYKTYHYQKLGLFLRKEAPPFKVRLSHLSPDIIYELSQLDEKDRRFVLKQAIGRIFEEINFDLYHDSISANLEVILTN
jgi:hypothetical protein